MAARTKSVGLTDAIPTQKCTDANCPFHGALKVRGKTFVGTVTSSKMQRSAIVEWEGRRLIPKFERYKRTRTKIAVHNPDCLNAREGDLVTVAECRPLSKTKSFVIIEVKGKKKRYALQKEALEEAKFKVKEESVTSEFAAKKTAEE
ncbi:30S ribosomal protein S17 [Candidatus Woesearchaeota archaeon]|nr:30S ribosomal protein S17 [Candidatus Woesearchaeota archaeon]